MAIHKSRNAPGARSSQERNLKFKEGYVVALSTVLIFFTFGFMYAVSPRERGIKVGFVNSAIILAQFRPARAVQARLDTLIQDWSDTLNGMIAEYHAKVDNLTLHRNAMSALARTHAQHEVDSLEQAIMEYRQATVGQGGDLAQTRAKLMNPVRKEIYGAISGIAREDGMQFVLDENPQTAIVLYADPRYDITYEVLNRLTREGYN